MIINGTKNKKDRTKLDTPASLIANKSTISKESVENIHKKVENNF